MMQASDTQRPDPGQAITVHQVAIALDCSTLNRVALDTAVGLAAATGAKLRAVFIEDQCLYSLGGLPFAREISYGGTVGNRFDAQKIGLEIARSARAAETAVSAAAARAQVEWAFDTVRGMLDHALVEAGEGAEILALGSSKPQIGRVHSIAVLRHTLRHGTGVIVAPASLEFASGPVVAILSPGAEAGIMVKTAERIAGQSGRPHRFLIVSDDAAERAALHQKLHEVQSSSVEVVFCEVNRLAEVTRTLRGQAPGLVIADIDYAHLDEAPSAERVSEAFGAPLLLIQI